MSTRLQKHPVLGTFHVYTLMELIQCAFQHALKAFHMSASELKHHKNRNNLVESEVFLTHCQIWQSCCLYDFRDIRGHTSKAAT